MLKAKKNLLSFGRNTIEFRIKDFYGKFVLKFSNENRNSIIQTLVQCQTLQDFF